MNLRRGTRRQLRALRDEATRGAVLLRLAATEALGADHLAVVARRQRDPDLRQALGRQAADCARHAEQLRAAAGAERAAAAPFDMLEGRDPSDLDLHGFPLPESQESLGVTGILAALHVAAVRSIAIYRVCRAHTGASSFAAILADLEEHARESKRRLEACDPAEVAASLKARRRSAFLAAWKRLGLRSGAGFSRAILYVVYWTALLPFGLLARWGKPQPATAEHPTAKPDDRALHTQY